MTLFGKLVFGIFALVIGATLFYSFGSYVKSDAELPVAVDATTTSPVATTTEITKKIPFSEFIQKGGSYSCTLALAGELLNASTSPYTVYFEDKDVKVFMVASDGVKNNMLFTNDLLYVWGDKNKKKGTSYNASSSDRFTLLAKNGFDIEKMGDYDCKEGVSNRVLFSLPEGVTFSSQ